METTKARMALPDPYPPELQEGARFPDSPYQKRRDAFVLDLVVYAAFHALLGALVIRSGIADAEEWVAFLVAPAIYWVGLVAVGVTPACWLCDLRIVVEGGEAPGLWRAFRRSLNPWTVWVLVASSANLFHPRIDAIYEAHPIIQDSMFWGGGLGLMIYFWVYRNESEQDDDVTMFHDAISGTRVIERRSKHKATLTRRRDELRASSINWSNKHVTHWFGRRHALPENDSEHAEGASWTS